jgi:hypothetical protein
MPSSRKFTTPGLKEPDGYIQHQAPRVTRNSYRPIEDFEKEFLFQNPTYMEMSNERQKSIQQEIQSIFFDWMMSKRVKRQTTTHDVKRNKYEYIMKKIILSFELESVAKPVFKCGGDFDLPMFEDLSMVEVEELRLCVSPLNLTVTGVIPFSRPIQLHCMPYSEPLTPTPQFDSEEGMELDCMPFSEPLSPTLESMSFLHSFPNLPFAADTAATVSAEDSSMLMNTLSVFEILSFPGVDETLSDIWNIKAQISGVFGSSFDQSLGPNDWLQSKYPSDPLAQIDKPDE